MDKKITPTDLKKQAQELIAAGKMPSIDDVLSAVADTRTKYQPQLEEAKKSNLTEATGLKDLSGKKD